MKKRILALVFVSTVMVTGLFSCYNDNSEDLYPLPPITSCDTANVTYTNTIKSIVDNQCATVGCHNGPVPSTIDLTNYNGLKNISNSNNRLMAALNHTGPFPMPKGLPKLDPCTIAKFQAWVNANEPE